MAGRVRIKAVPPEEERLLYSIEEAGALVGLSSDTVRRWLKDGDLVASRLNGRLYVMREDLLAYLREHREVIA